MPTFYCSFAENDEAAKLFARNKRVYQWIENLPDEYHCFVEFSWSGRRGQSDFMLFGNNSIVNIEVKNWQGYLKGDLNANWTAEGKSMDDNPYRQAVEASNSFAKYLEDELPDTGSRNAIKVWPVVALPNAAHDSDIPDRGQGGFGSIVTNEQQFLAALKKLSPLKIKIDRGITMSIARSLSLTIRDPKNLNTIISQHSGDQSEEDTVSYITDTTVTGYDKRFFGRLKELDILLNSLIRGDHVMIVGAQRTGKSSLVEELKIEGARLFKEKADKLKRMLFVEVDFQGIGRTATLDDFEQRFRKGIADSIESDFVSRGQRPGSQSWSTIDGLKFDSDLPRFLRRHLYPHVCQHYGFDKIVFFLDEFSELFETILFNSLTGSSRKRLVDVELMRFLSSLMKDKDLKGSIVYILALRPFSSYYHDRYDLQIFKCVGTPIGLDYFDFETTANLVRKPAEGIINFSDDAVNEIYGLTAGHPWFTSMFCKVLMQQVNPDGIQEANVDRGIISRFAAEMTSNEKAFQYDHMFSVIETDFTLEDDKRALGKQTLALVSNLFHTNKVWPTFEVLFIGFTQHKEISVETLSGVLAEMVHAKILREVRRDSGDLEYQIRMGIIKDKYVNQNLFHRYFR